MTPGRGGAALQPWVRVALVGYVAVQMSIQVSALSLMHSIRPAIHTYEAQVRAEQPGQVPTLHLPASTGYLYLGQLVIFGLAVVWLVWQHRVATEARRRGYPASHSPGFGVGCWFIPVVNLWMPYQALRDCLPPGHPARRWALPAWLCFLGGGVAGGTAVFAGYFSDGAGAVALLVALGLWVGLVVLGLRLVGAVGADQADPGQSPGQGGWQVSQA